jgi:hypothetical protein
MDYMGKVHVWPMQARLYYESVWLKVEITRKILLEISRNEF